MTTNKHNQLTVNQKFKLLNNLNKNEVSTINKFIDTIFGEDFFTHVRCKIIYWIIKSLCEHLKNKGIFTDYQVDCGLADGCRIYFDEENDSIEVYDKFVGSRNVE